MLATLVGKDPRLVEVAKNLGDLLEGINQAAGDFKDSPLKSLPQIHAQLVDALKSLPNEVAKTDRSAELIPYLQNIQKSITAQKLDPQVNVNAPEVDLKPLTNYLSRLETATKAIKMPELDLSSLQVSIQEVRDAISGLRFPVPNYVLPFANADGDATQITLNAAGSLPTAGVLVTEAFDYISAAYPDDTTETYTYKSGGSGGTTVATVTVVYSDSTKAELTSVTKA